MSLPQLAAVTAGSWLLAVAPVAALLGLMVWGRFSTALNAALALLGAIGVGVVCFGAGPAVVAVGLAKGAWIGVWILAVIWPALMMHHLATQVGMSELGRQLAEALPNRTENILLLAWILPSFIQGVSGFGTPVAVAAPLLAALGLGAAPSVALALIGYQWSVGFGSMGSPFYMSALTAGLDDGQRADLAVSTALVLGVNCLLAGVLVALMAGGLRGLRDGLRLIVTAGTAMVIVQFVVARLEPGLATVCAGGAGLLAVAVHRATSRRLRTDSAPRPQPGAQPNASTDRRQAPADRRRARAAIVPYLLLTAIALAVFLPPGSRSWVKTSLLIGPSFPATRTAEGVVNAAEPIYTPIAPAGHPGTFLLLACLGSYLIWRSTACWPPGAGRAARAGFLRQIRRTSPAVVLLAALAGLLIDTGIVTTTAQGIAAVSGNHYPSVAPLVGALGSFITGSTANSNALFSALQHDIAVLIGERPADLLAGQQGGGNIGNALSPVAIVLGLSSVGGAVGGAVGTSRATADVLRRTAAPAVVLLAATVLTTWALVLTHG